MDISHCDNLSIFLDTTMILREINFGWFQKVKICHFNNFQGFEFWFLEKFHTWKCQMFPKIQNSELLKRSKWLFLGLHNVQMISRKIWVAEKSWNFCFVYLQLGCLGLYTVIYVQDILLAIQYIFWNIAEGWLYSVYILKLV